MLEGHIVLFYRLFWSETLKLSNSNLEIQLCQTHRLILALKSKTAAISLDANLRRDSSFVVLDYLLTYTHTKFIFG